jgi:hypothetical protein
MTPVRLGVATVLIAAGVFCALLAADVRSWASGLRAGDTHFSQAPRAARWSPPTILPFDPASRILDLSDQLAFRRALRSFVGAESLGNGFDNGYSESRTRAAVETTLAKVAQSSDARRASQAENLLGILAFADSRQRGPSAPAPIDRSVAAFQAAVRLDPSNEAAKFNLEWLLRRLAAKGTRRGSNASSSGPAKGHRGAGGGLPGRGY